MANELSQESVRKTLDGTVDLVGTNGWELLTICLHPEHCQAIVSSSGERPFCHNLSENVLRGALARVFRFGHRNVGILRGDIMDRGSFFLRADALSCTLVLHTEERVDEYPYYFEASRAWGWSGKKWVQGVSAEGGGAA